MAGRKHCKDKRSNPLKKDRQSDWSNLGDPDDVMETSLTIDYDKQWLSCVSAIGPTVSE